MSMPRVRSRWELPAFALLAVAQALALLLLTTHMEARWAVVLAIGGAAFAVPAPLALPQALVRLRELKNRFSWWHWLWLLLFASGLVFRVRDTNQAVDTPLDFWAAYRALLVGAVAFVLAARLALGVTPWLHSLCRGLLGAMALHTAVALASSLWSVYPAWTGYKSAEYFVDLALIAAALAFVRSARSFRHLFDWMWTVWGALLATVWAGALLWPDQAWLGGTGLLGRQIQGVLPAISANGVGELAAALAIVSVSRLHFGAEARPGRAMYGVVLAMSLLTLAFSQTRSALAGFVAGVGLVLFLSRRVGAVALLLFAAIFALSLTNAADVVWAFVLRGQTPELFSSFSGRAVWWDTAIEAFRERPLIGYGAYAGGRFVALSASGATVTSSLHNAYLEVLMGTGLLGLAMLLVALLGSWWVLIGSARRLPLGSAESQLAIEAAGVLALVTVRSMFTSNLIWHPPLDFLLVLGYAEFLRRRRAA